MRAPTATQRLVQTARELSGALDAQAAAGTVETERVADAARLIERLARHAERLEHELAKLRPKEAGRASEKLDREALQQSLFAASEAPTAEEQRRIESPTPAPAPDAEPPRKPAADRPSPTGRRPLPRSLPRVEVVVPAPAEQCVCAVCGVERRVIGYDCSEVLDAIPAKLQVLVYKREKRACCEHPEAGVATAPPVPRPIEKGMASSGLLASIAIAKYLDHTPLHRQHRQFLRHGCDLAVSTLTQWIGSVHSLLVPLARRIQHHAMASHLLQADATGLLVLDRDDPKGARLGQLWGIVGDSQWAVFRFAKDHGHHWPKLFFGSRRGWLQVDAHPSYDALFAAAGAEAVEVGCWVHARRNFFELHEKGDPRVDVPLAWIQQLYAIESAADAAGDTPDDRAERRKTHGLELIQRFARWLVDTLLAETPGSAFFRAVAYCVKNWRALTRFLHDGRLPLDNNGAERILRPVALGRKNYLFAGNDAGAERAATFYTLFATCTLAGLNPWLWLTDTLQKLAEDWPDARIDELLPTRSHPLARPKA